jgi:hypothetical protein
MLSVIRPDFEAVKEEGILNKIKHIHLSILAAIKPSLQFGSFAKSRHRRDSLRSARCQVLDENGVFLPSNRTEFLVYYPNLFNNHFESRL